MSVAAGTAGDYLNLGYNVLPCVPKSGYVPVKGNLIQRENAAANEVDVCASTELPAGIVMTVGAGAAPSICGVAFFVPGTTVVLPAPSGSVPALGADIEVDAGGMVALGLTGLTRTRVADSSAGVGRVIARDTVNLTVTVAF